MRRHLAVLMLLSLAPVGAVAHAQTIAPQPFPRAGQEAAAPTAPASAGQAAQAPSRASVPAAPEQPPTEATLGLPFYPTLQFIASYDAGRGQRYYLFGTTASFAEVVAYYKSVLKQKGSLVFEEPATHMFEIGKFKEDAVAFPPGITVKDYTWGGMQGYPNPKPGAEPATYATVVQMVPMPTGTGGER